MIPLQPMNFPPVTGSALPETLALPAQGTASDAASFVMPELPLIAVSAGGGPDESAPTSSETDTQLPDDVAEQLAQLLNFLVPQETPVAPVAPVEIAATEQATRVLPAGIEPSVMPVTAETKTPRAQTSAALATAASVAESLSQPGAQNTLKPLAMSPALISLAQRQEGAEKPVLTPGTQQQPAGVLPASFQTAHNPPDITQGRSEAASRAVNMPMNITDGTQIQGEKLRQVLGERLQLQLDNRVQHATIRLDPPELGKIEISLQLDANKLQVQIQAGQPEVARALQQVSHELRQSLTAQNNLQVQVNISSQQQSSQQQGQHPSQTPYQPANLADIAPAARSRADDMSSVKPLDTSILTTV
ncbi:MULTISPECIES: flagellar hook-length control protein FliK [Rahnella]|nr:MULTISPECIES: flagellar hook-length control protein FliK [Rahnella]